jgi:putative hydroxymethylpyrimidine transport system substrate-binding protein
MVKIFCSVLALMAAVALLIGCGEGSETVTEETRTEPVERPQRPDAGDKPEPSKPERKLRFMQITMDGKPSPENAGLLLADRLGYFADAGIDVAIYGPVLPARTVGYIAEGSSLIGVANEPEVVLAREKGMPLVVIGSLVDQPTMAMMWLPDSGIDGVSDLKGKTIAIPGLPFQKRFLEVILKQAGLSLGDVKLERAGYGLVNWLADGRADAIFGGSGNVEGAVLEGKGLEPVITPVTSLGVPGYDELVFIARKDSVAKDPKLLRRFMTAARRGTAAAIADPKAASEAVVDKSLERAPVKATEAGVEATLPLYSKTGRASAEQASGLIDWMHEEGLIRRKLPVSALLAG